MLFWHLGITVAIVYATLGKRRIDYRVVLIGAILPDLIDKPIGRIFFEDTFETSRVFGHTLLLWVAVLLVIQIFLRGDSARRWFILPIAAMLHLALDGMWAQPVTLLWPLFGLQFPRVPVENYWLEVLLRPLRHPIEALKELAGLVALGYIWRAYNLTNRKVLTRFLRSGRLQDERRKDGAPQSNDSG